jgi:hypothetical protein
MCKTANQAQVLEAGASRIRHAKAKRCACLSSFQLESSQPQHNTFLAIAYFSFNRILDDYISLYYVFDFSLSPYKTPSLWASCDAYPPHSEVVYHA